ncbi:MAG: phosphoglycerate kinase [Ignavibacteria bacterium]|nr:phosphoglycerate kinase [Ignavibacteria bacterium]
MGLFQSHCRFSAKGFFVMVLSISEANVSGKKVLTRVDFNVPLNDDGSIADDTRIVESIPTILSIIERGGVAVLMSHMGRPKGKPNAKYSLDVVAKRLSVLLDEHVQFVPDCIGADARQMVAASKSGDVLLLENLRFHAEEELNDEYFSKELSELGDIYCNDAFGTAHRAHSSTVGVTHFFNEKFAGLLMQRELKYLGEAIVNPKRPLVIIVGGSKISGKIDVITSLMKISDSILIGGGMMFTFLRALGYSTGSSLVEEDKIQLASEILTQAKTMDVKLILPTDVSIANSFSNDADSKIVSITEIEDGWMGLDIGPETSKLYSEVIKNAGTVVWNGPMGVFEFSNFSHGTRSVSQAMVDATTTGTITIVGGGDSAAAVSQFGHQTNVTHVSTGGGASLEFLEGKSLPGVTALNLE